MKLFTCSAIGCESGLWGAKPAAQVNPDAVDRNPRPISTAATTLCHALVRRNRGLVVGVYGIVCAAKVLQTVVSVVAISVVDGVIGPNTMR
jgi:hypothetical protein